MRCIAPLTGGALASGCYDGVVRLWEVSSQDGSAAAAGPSSSFAAHRGPIKAAVALRSSAGQLLLTAGGDMVGRVWRGVGEAGDEAGQPQAVAVLRGHSEGVEAAAASADGRACCTGGWDGKLLLWQSGERTGLRTGWPAAGQAVRVLAREGSANHARHHMQLSPLPVHVGFEQATRCWRQLRQQRRRKRRSSNRGGSVRLGRPTTPQRWQQHRTRRRRGGSCAATRSVWRRWRGRRQVRGGLRNGVATLEASAGSLWQTAALETALLHTG